MRFFGLGPGFGPDFFAADFEAVSLFDEGADFGDVSRFGGVSAPVLGLGLASAVGVGLSDAG